MAKTQVEPWEYHFDCFGLTTCYLHICLWQSMLRDGVTQMRVPEAIFHRPEPPATALREWAPCLLPHVRDAKLLPDEGLFAGEVPVAAAGRTQTSACRLIRELSVDTLESMVLAARKAVPNPVRLEWPCHQELRLTRGDVICDKPFKLFLRLLKTQPDADSIATRILVKLPLKRLPDEFVDSVEIEGYRAERRLADKKARASTESIAREEALREMLSFTECLNLFAHKVPTDKRLRAILDKHPEIRRFNPRPQRLLINVADLARYFARIGQQANAALDAVPFFAAEAKKLQEELRREKQAGRRGQA